MVRRRRSSFLRHHWWSLESARYTGFLADSCRLRGVRASTRRGRLPKALAEKTPSERGVSGTTHYWTYSPGGGAARWDDFYARGITWASAGASSGVRRYVNAKGRHPQSLRTLYSSGSRQEFHTRSGSSLVVEAGRVVFAKPGHWRDHKPRRREGTTIRRRNGAPYEHPQVRWTHGGGKRRPPRRPERPQMDITTYPDLVAKARSFFEGRDGEPREELRRSQIPYTGIFSRVYMDAERDPRQRPAREEGHHPAGAPGVEPGAFAQAPAYSMMGCEGRRSM